MTNRYPFHVAWFELPVVGKIVFWFVLISDFVVKYTSLEGAFSASTFGQQVALTITCITTVFVLDVLPDIAARFIGENHSMSKHRNKLLLAVVITTALLYVVTVILGGQAAQAKAIKQAQNSSATIIQGNASISTELVNAEKHKASTASVLTAILPIESTIFLAFYSFVTAKTKRKIALYNKKCKLQKQHDKLSEDLLKLQTDTEREAMLEEDDADREIALNYIKVYLTDWAKQLQLPLLTRLNSPQDTSRILADTHYIDIFEEE